MRRFFILQSYLWAQFFPSAYFASERETVLSVARWVESMGPSFEPIRLAKKLPFFTSDSFVLEADGFRGRVELYSKGRYLGELEGSGKILLRRRWCEDQIEFAFYPVEGIFVIEGGLYIHAVGLREKEPIWRYPDTGKGTLQDTYVDWVGWQKNLEIWRVPYRWVFPSLPPRPLRALIAYGKGTWKVGKPPPMRRVFSLTYFVPFLIGLVVVLIDWPLGYGIASGVIGFFLGHEIGKPIGIFVFLAVTGGYFFVQSEKESLLKGWFIGGLVSWCVWVFWPNLLGVWGVWNGIRIIKARSLKVLYLCLLEIAILFLLRWL